MTIVHPGNRRARALVQGGVLAAMLPGVAGCSGAASLNPIDWWHNLEGGPIAAARPPPPNADAPYPTLGSVPDRPTGNDAAARGQIADALVADRANAQYDATIAPLTPAAPQPPSPAPTGDNTSSGTFAAASPPPPPVPRAAPRAPVQTAALPPPVAAGAAAPTAAVVAAALPEMPPAPPAPAELPGVAQVTAPTPPAPTPPPVVTAAPAPVAGAPIAVSFVPGLAVLPTSAYAPLKALAQQRGSGSIAVIGFGAAAADASPATQQSAMPLALARARAIAAYLETAGVPAAIIRVDAEASGQGGAARLIR